MIKSKEELKYYLEKDKKALWIKIKKPCRFGADIWKFQIANGCIIGANAVVTKDFREENSIIAGCPAKVIGFKK